MRLRVLVCGVGDFGALHAAVVRDHPEADLVGLVDLDRDRAAALAGPGVEVGTDLAASLRALAPDAVIVATPEQEHVTGIRTSLAAGCHVLVEKPVSLDPDEVKALRDEVAAGDLVVMPGHVSRFLPEVATVLEQPSTVRHISASRYVPRARVGPHGRIHPAWMAMIHDLDLVAGLVPAASQVRIHAAQRFSRDELANPDTCVAVLDIEGGPLAVVENAWFFPHERQYIDARLRVATDDALFEVTTPADGLVRTAADGEHRPALAIDGRVADRPVGALSVQLEHLVDSIRGRLTPRVTLDDAYRAGVLARGVVDAAASAQPVVVTLS